MKTDFLKDKSSNLFSGPIIFTPEIFLDDRGYFFETWNKKTFSSLVNSEVDFVQDNESYSEEGTLRGLHYQLNPYSQGKLIRVISGEIFDVAVDLRRSSENFGKWISIKLSAENKKQLWIPKGFAHGFLTMTNEAEVIYKTTDYWSLEFERCITWNDNDIGINWPIKNPILSEKDLNGVKLIEAEVFE